MNTPKTIEERIIELRGITLKIEELIRSRSLRKCIGLKTTEQDVEKDILSESFNIKLKELLTAQDRISKKSIKEIVICSAIRMSDGYIIRGHRHNDCLLTASTIPRYKSEKAHGENQGFVTSLNRYVTREEGCRLQKEAGIKSYYETHRGNPFGAYMNEELYSEDLY